MEPTMPLGHAICPQPGHSSGSAGDFEFSKKIKVADMLLHLDQTKHTFINKQQVYNYLLDVMEAFKSENTASLNIAQNQLHELLQEHFEVLMSFITFCSLSYRTEEHPNDSEYDFEVSIVLHGLTEIDIATLSQDQNIASPFAASSSIPVKGSPGLHTSQRPFSKRTVRIRIPNNKMKIPSFLPPLRAMAKMCDSYIIHSLTQSFYSEILNQSHSVTNRGQKRKRDCDS